MNQYSSPILGHLSDTDAGSTPSMGFPAKVVPSHRPIFLVLFHFIGSSTTLLGLVPTDFLLLDVMLCGSAATFKPSHPHELHLFSNFIDP